jgi:hypothetical protein
MKLYPAIQIPVGQWRFFPEAMVAQNMHNGNWATFHRSENGWIVHCINCPAQWMLKELAEWFGKWITGKVDK